LIYLVYFDIGKLPPVATFWNMAMYAFDMLFVENDFGRYSIGITNGWAEEEPRRLADNRNPKGPSGRHVKLAACADGKLQSDLALLRS
jgi:hypothetical protein